jgi:hypothetical protein
MLRQYAFFTHVHEGKLVLANFFTELKTHDALSHNLDVSIAHRLIDSLKLGEVLPDFLFLVVLLTLSLILSFGNYFLLLDSNVVH